MKKYLAILILATVAASCGCKGWSCQKRYVSADQQKVAERKNA